MRRDLCPARVSQNGCDLLAGQILLDGPIKMIHSDRPGGKQTRRSRMEPAHSETGDCRVETPTSILVARLSMSHLVPLLEFNHLPNAKLPLRSLAGLPVRGVARPHNCGAPTPGGIGRPRAAAPALPGQLILWDVCPAAYAPVSVRRPRWCVVCRSCAPNDRSGAALRACEINAGRFHRPFAAQVLAEVGEIARR